MNIADFFINLKLNGKNDVVKGVGEVGSQLTDVRSMSLEAKAAILGVVYSFEQMMSQAMHTSTSVENFSQVTGIAAKEVQQYRYAMEGFGGNAEEIQNYLGTLQKMVSDSMWGDAPLKGLESLKAFAGEQTQEDLENTTGLAQKLFAIMQNPNIRAVDKRKLAEQWNMPDSINAAAQNDAFNQAKLNKARTVSEATLKANRDALGQWKQMWTDITMMMAQFNGEHGAQMIRDLRDIVKSLLDVASQFLKLADQLHLFQEIALLMKDTAFAIKSSAQIIHDVTSKPGTKSQYFTDESAKTSLKEVYKNGLGNSPEEQIALYKKMTANGSGNAWQDFQNAMSKADINVNVTSNNYGVKDAAEVGERTGKEVGSTMAKFRQGF